jgi:hypothetical protein
MPACQISLPLLRPHPARLRSLRRPFHPSPALGPYRLPNEVRDRLTIALAPRRNREAAFALATFLGRFWSAPGRVIGSFPIDRCALADRPDLGLTEGQIRGAIRVLEEIGFIDRALVSGSKYRATEDGLRRKPVLFMFGSEYAPALIAANRRAGAARGGPSHQRRPVPPSMASRASTALPGARPLSLPESKSEASPLVLIGKQTQSLPSRPEPNLALEAALDRLLQGIRQSRGA